MQKILKKTHLTTCYGIFFSKKFLEVLKFDKNKQKLLIKIKEMLKIYKQKMCVNFMPQKRFYFIFLNNATDFGYKTNCKFSYL